MSHSETYQDTGPTSVFYQGVHSERKKVVKYLKNRVDDFNICSKKDSCDDIAYVIEGIIEDIEKGQL